MVKVIKFVCSKNYSPYKKPKKEQEPIKRSNYAQLLFDEGAGWNEQKTDRADFKRL